MDYLNRGAAGFDDDLWTRIDAAAVQAARDILTVRRFLPVEGPYGLGLTAVETGNDGYCKEAAPGEAGAIISRAISMPMLRRSFKLSIRRIEGYRCMGQPLSFTPVVEAAEAVARREESFMFYGRQEFGVSGLLNVEGRSHHKGGDWGSTQEALDDVLAAVTALDQEGFHGPYALALAPALYNDLFRRYEGTDMLQLEHLRRLCDLGVYKAAIDGGVLVDQRAGRVLIGQDLMTGYAHQDGIHHELYVAESLVLLMEQPNAICTIATAGTA